MVKKILSFIMALLIFNVSIFAGTPLLRGTTLSVRLTAEISSQYNGVSPYAMVENDVRSRDGEILIRRGTPVAIEVDRKKAKGCGKPGYTNVRCISTTAVDGQNITLEGNIASEGEDRKGLAIGLGVGLGLTFLPIVGFAFLALKGDNAKIPVNTLVHSVFVMNDYEIAL